jgi:sarcosine oxidase, subunit gamma
MSDDVSTPAPVLPEQGHEAQGGACHIAYCASGHVLQVVAKPFAGDLSMRLAAIADGSPCALRQAGPGIWYIVGDSPLSPDGVAEKEAHLGRDAMLIDQSHGRVRLELSGPGSARLLSTGTAVDLGSSRFERGSACETLFGHIGIHLTRTAAESFEILVGRSFAMSLWHELTS